MNLLLLFTFSKDTKVQCDPSMFRAINFFHLWSFALRFFVEVVAPCISNKSYYNSMEKGYMGLIRFGKLVFRFERNSVTKWVGSEHRHALHLAGTKPSPDTRCEEFQIWTTKVVNRTKIRRLLNFTKCWNRVMRLYSGPSIKSFMLKLFKNSM